MVHLFERNDLHIALDIPTGAVHALDALSYKICGLLKAPVAERCPPEVHTVLRAEYSPEEIEEAYAELYALAKEGLLFSEDDRYPASQIKPGDAPIKALCLHVSHDCNLRCSYCFAQTGDFGGARKLMTPDVARKAIDFVLVQSGARRNIEIDFFGGEPLMAWDTVVETVEYANEQAEKFNKNFRFTMTTNGVLLSDEKIEYLNKTMSNCVLSLDGRKETNDAMRKTVGGAGSYERILPRFKKLVETRARDKDYYIRGTYTANNLDFSADVLSLYHEGFDQVSIEPVSAPDGVGYELKEQHLPVIQAEYWKLVDELLAIEDRGEWLNFFHFNVDLEQGPCVIKRLRGCGAGCEYVAVTPEGDVYPCHQFVGMPEFLMGNLMDGSFDKRRADQFAEVSVYTRKKCSECWARFYCSGGCSAANFQFNGDIQVPYEIGCELERMRLECALYLAVYRALK